MTASPIPKLVELAFLRVVLLGAVREAEEGLRLESEVEIELRGRFKMF